MTIEAKRITRLREALDQIAKADIDAADLAPAWATAALAADDQLALAIASRKALAEVACFDDHNHRRRGPGATLYPGDVVRRKSWPELPGKVISTFYDPGEPPRITADHGPSARRQHYPISQVTEVISRGEIGQLNDKLDDLTTGKTTPIAFTKTAEPISVEVAASHFAALSKEQIPARRHTLQPFPAEPLTDKQRDPVLDTTGIKPITELRSPHDDLAGPYTGSITVTFTAQPDPDKD